MKKCTKCGLIKPLSEFSFQNIKQNKYMSNCKECRSEYQKSFRRNNIDKVKEKDRNKYLKNSEKLREYAREYRRKYPERTRRTNWKRYGITEDDFYRMLNEQGNKCAICGRDMIEYGKIFCVDHCHSTNKVRGLLCDPCNYGLGFYEKHKDKYVNYLSKVNSYQLTEKI